MSPDEWEAAEAEIDRYVKDFYRRADIHSRTGI